MDQFFEMTLFSKYFLFQKWPITGVTHSWSDWFRSDWFSEVTHFQGDQIFKVTFSRNDRFEVIHFPKWQIPEITHFSSVPFRSQSFSKSSISKSYILRSDPFSQVTYCRNDRFRSDSFSEVTLSDVTSFPKWNALETESDPFSDDFFPSGLNP